MFLLPKHGSGPYIPARYYMLIVFVILFFHFILSIAHESYGQATSISRITPDWVKEHSPWAPSGKTNKPASTSLNGDELPQAGHLPQVGTSFACLANATFVILARNYELKDLVKTLVQIEDRFNHQYHYPYVFLNEEPFTDEFKRWTSTVVSSKVQYGHIPPEHWYQPDDIDEARAAASREDMVKNRVIYGGSVSYRNMCRFNSGFFFRHELTQKYRYYWRIEPGVDFFCNVNEDPFMYLQENNKVYGFTISMYEFQRTIPTLWDVTKEFITQNPQYVAENNAMGFLSDNGGNDYNLCHFWSNFEIADMDFWRSEAYMKYFDFLESKGGFYYERWGDAPVHSIGAALFARKDQIHFFKEIGYRHNPFQHCPQGELHKKGKCWCDENDNFDYER
ncbi:putative mannosyltransferase [Serendipita vermifera]|nr:putative mannosyltransferase [Serendipita vermifera]